MESLVKLALFIMLIPLSNSIESSADAYKFRKENIQCNNDSTCPTWFTCDAKKRCQCGKVYREIRFYVIAELTFQQFQTATV